MLKNKGPINYIENKKEPNPFDKLKFTGDRSGLGNSYVRAFT